MNSFTGSRLLNLAFSDKATQALTTIETATLRNAQFTDKPDEFLTDCLAVNVPIDSAMSSNSMEGVLIRPRRRDALMWGEAPDGHHEQQVWNYMQAVKWIEAGHFELVPEGLRALHAKLRLGFRGASEWRSREAQDAVAELCEGYKAFRVHDGFRERFIAAAALALDFHNLHPFRDGVPHAHLTRLLVVRGLHPAGVRIQRYLPIEEFMEKTKVQYTSALAGSSRGWKDGRHDPAPWVSYLASIVQWVYREFERCAWNAAPREAPEILGSEEPVRTAPDVPGERPASHKSGRPPGRSDDMTTKLIKAIDGLPKRFTVSDVRKACPGPKDDLIRGLLKELKAEGKIRPVGFGRSAAWEKTEKWTGSR